MNRDEAISRIKTALKKRTGRVWSVTGGRGTAWGWVRISAPPKRLENGSLSDLDRAALARAMGFDLSEVHRSGISIPASSAYYRAHVERAETGSTELNPQPYWD